MNRLVLLLTLPLMTAAASAPLRPQAEPMSASLARAQSEARAADAQVRRLEKAVLQAQDRAARLRAGQAAAAEAIVAAEARISAADVRARLLAAVLAERRARLREQQRPVSSLLAGLALMAQRPPLLAIAGGTDTDELVRVRLLLDSTLPVIRERTAALSRELARGEQLERQSAQARQALLRSRAELAQRKRHFAALEAEALRRAAQSGVAAIGAGDEALAAGEEVGRLAGAAARNQPAIRTASELAMLGVPPARPGAATPAVALPRLAYRLPAAAPVVEGLGAVSSNGIRSRGLTLATRRGQAVVVPAAGIIRFAGPFRDYDGVTIIDHGNGWMSLIVNVGSQIEPGTRVEAGAPLGRALGPLGVELSRNGQHWSPALIAGSSQMLSNGDKGG
jgi:septal ring factor EnvC (AmiA/AmiB activator)